MINPDETGRRLGVRQRIVAPGGQTERVLLTNLVTASATVAATSSRTQKLGTLAELLAGVADADLAPALGLLVADPRQGRLGVGWAAVSRLHRGAVLEPTLTIADVDTAFDRLAAGGEDRREVLAALFDRATDEEHDFLGRVIVGELRQGALAALLADAAAVAAGVPAAAVRRAWMFTGSLAEAALLARTGGAERLAAVGLEVGRPVQPMLAGSATSVAAAMADRAMLDPAAGKPATPDPLIPEVVVDYKLDGARIQVHRNGSDIHIYTRTLNDVTQRLPEIVAIVAALPARTVVLDGESLVLDERERPTAFSDTMSRFSADAPRAAIVRPYFFDLLHLDGTDFVDRPFTERRRALADVAGEWMVSSVSTADPVRAQEVFDEALAAGHEGVVVKSRHATYAAGRRGRGWQKVKPVRTLDLVVLAAEWGHGRRTGRLSNLHLGARDPAGSYGPPGGLVMVGKTFKGLTDKLLTWQTEQFQAHEVRRRAGTVWVAPRFVVEIGFDGAQTSRRYPGGAALRFARVLRYRPDQTAVEADTIDAVREWLPGRQ